MRVYWLIAGLLLAGPALAQPAVHPNPDRTEATRTEAGQGAAAVRAPLPADSVTHHSLDLPGRTLHFTATAGAFRITDAQGHPEADVATITYTLDDAEPATRPVAFVVNGGPGAASAWLQLGAMGPWRLPVPHTPTPSMPSAPVPNAETWLDFADLVFIDPPGAGYSRLASGSDDVRRRLLSVEGDIPPLAEVMRRWTVKHGRAASPRMIVGESYGGFRGPRLARALQDTEGLGVAALVLISPVLDFDWHANGTDPMSLMFRLPSMAAVAAESAGHQPNLDAAEQYAAGDFLADLLRGPRDAAAVDRLTAHVAPLTGLDPALVRRRAGRIDLHTFLRDMERGRVGSAYDGTVSSPDAAPQTPWTDQPDPVLDALRAPLTEAMMTIYRLLAWQPDGAYHVLNDGVARSWDWGHGLRRPDSMRALTHALALDPAMRVLVAHGRDDLVTPYFATKLRLAQMPELGTPGRVRLLVTPGGHMLYDRDDSRAALREAARALLQP